MLETEVIPAYYVVEVSGTAVKSIIPGNFGIDHIAIGSLDFPNDLSALSALQTAMRFISAQVDITLPEVEERIDYNPEFFPTMKPLELTDQNKDDHETAIEIQEELDDNADEIEMLNGTRQIAVPITKVFDPLGDFVETRWTISAPDFRFQGKVFVTPDAYLYQKALRMVDAPEHAKKKSVLLN
jgi:hypothetical protein